MRDLYVIVDSFFRSKIGPKETLKEYLQIYTGYSFSPDDVRIILGEYLKMKKHKIIQKGGKEWQLTLYGS